MNEQKTEIRIQFKDVTSGIFKDIPRNELVIRVQPNESVYIKMNSKLPGLSMQTAVTELDLTYRRRFSDLKIPEAYEALILDALKGDHSNFVRDDELDASWRIFTPLLHYLDENKEIIPMEYPYGKLLLGRCNRGVYLTWLQVHVGRLCWMILRPLMVISLTTLQDTNGQSRVLSLTNSR